MTDRSKALLALALLVPAPSIGAAMMLLISPGLVGTIVSGLCKLWTFGLPLVWLLYVDRLKPAFSRPRADGILPGVLSGCLIAIVMLGAYYGFGKDWVDPEQVRAKAKDARLNSPLNYAILFSFLILLNSLLEEYVWRWFVFRKCEVIMPGVWAVLVSALLFTIHHVFALSAWVPWHANFLASLGVFLGGCIWSGLYLRYRAIWPGYVSHVFADVAIFVMGWDLIFG